MLQLQLFGSAQIVLDGTVIRALTSLKSRALLYYLATEGRSYSRLALGGLLWPDKSDSAARVNLRQAVRQLRLAIGDYLLSTRDTVGLDSSLPLLVDVREFERQIALGSKDNLQTAVDLYTGEFLAGFYAEELLDFENWLLLQRERLRQLGLQALQQLAGQYTAEREVGAALRTTARLLALEPWHEESYRQMMRLLAEEGQISAALAQYETCRQVLASELGVEPSTETTTLYQQIRHSRSAGRPSQLEPETVQMKQVVPHNLPREFTKFVGREASVSQLQAWLLQPACALITIHGPGGIGKTRLAVETAYACLSEYPDGAWFVDLSTIEDPDNLFSAIAASLGLKPSGQSDVRVQVLQHLEERNLLLVLDNFEHLLGGTGRLLEILHRARRVQILLTSRVSLKLQAEWLFAVDGLPVPEPGDANLADTASVRLFVMRMAQIRPGYTLSAEDLVAIGEICRQVAGMPLAIELAAALTRSRTPVEISTDIVQDSSLLATTLTDIPVRQRSLRAVFNYSWALLNPQERRALAALAVFRGSFSTVAAASVTGTGDTMLWNLQDKSLLQQPLPGRYELHELLRQYAAEKGEAEESAQVTRLHCSFYLNFVHERANALWQPGAPLVLAEIQREWGNISRGWQFALATRNLALLAESESGLHHFHVRTGRLHEGASFFGGAASQLLPYLAEASESTFLEQVLARLLANEAHFLLAQAKYQEAANVTQRALPHARTAGDRQTMARSNLVWAKTLTQQGDLVAAEEHLEQAREQAQAAQAFREVGAALADMGVLYFHRGEHIMAGAYMQRAADAYARTADYGGMAQVHNNLAIIAARLGNYPVAKELYERALQVYREIGEYGGEALVLANLGIVATHTGHFDEGQALVERALAMSREAHMQRLACALLNTYGCIRLRQGDLDAAEALLDQALELARAIGNRYTESETLSNRSLLALYQGSPEDALALARDALRISQLAGEQTLAGFAWMAVGRAREALGEYTRAAEAYETALALRKVLAHPGLLLETQARLAHLAQREGRATEAQQIAGAIWAQLVPDESSIPDRVLLYGTEEPDQILLTCYRIFATAGDPRAEMITHRREDKRG